MRDFLYRVRRTWKLVRVYWSTEDCDWSSIAIVLRHQISRVREHIQSHNIIADAERCAAQMRKSEILLDRIIAGDYHELADKRYPDRGKHWADMIQELEKEDMRLLSDELRRHLRNWWD
jgi:hypothetical protein